MKIDGIDPLLLNRIKEQVDRIEIKPAEGSATGNRVNREGGQSRPPRGQAALIPDRPEEEKVSQALQRLNDDAEKDGLPLRFNAHREGGRWQIEVREASGGRLVRSIETGQALGVVNRIHSLFGGLLDEKR